MFFSFCKKTVVLLFFFTFILFPKKALADGAIRATIIGPHGETEDVSSTFTNLNT
ncbi:MAG: hypothetical protein KatS3mg090_0521 [Patescibacteria group bacterium]|nr:MAG: hypothetical protein KatS3mg090_0521 [Patescibacteria group bacterium]